MTDAAYGDLLSAVIAAVITAADGTDAIVSILNNEVPALITAVMGTGGGLCTTECKAFMTRTIYYPTAYLTTQSTMLSLFSMTSSMLGSLGLPSEFTSWVTGLPAAFTLDTRLPAIAATNLPECMCNVDILGVYDLAKSVAIGAIQDPDPYFFSGGISPEAWYPFKLSRLIGQQLPGLAVHLTLACVAGQSSNSAKTALYLVRLMRIAARLSERLERPTVLQEIVGS